LHLHIVYARLNFIKNYNLFDVWNVFKQLWTKSTLVYEKNDNISNKMTNVMSAIQSNVGLGLGY